jgi:hypothetical protein
MPVASTATQTTRFLCAGAYLDWQFADHVVSTLLQGDHSTPAPSHGVDVVPVVRHAVRARTWRLVRNLLVTLALVSLPISVLFGGASPIDGLIRTVLVVWGVVFGALCVVHYEILVPQLLRNRFSGHDAPALPNRQERRLAELAAQSSSNVTVYSGFSPFVGCGIDLGSWSFVVDVRRGKEGLDGARLRPDAFEVGDLYGYTLERLNALCIEGLHTESRLFVHGREARGLGWLLPDILDRPLARVEPGAVDHFLRFPTEQVRHYLAMELVEWHGELVLSIFLRFSRTGGNLFCEASYFLLPPVKEEYHKIDDLHATPDLGQVARLLGRSLVTTPFVLVVAPFAVLDRVLGPLTRWYREVVARRVIKFSPTFDYGTSSTLRQHAMSPNYRHYFQKLDKEMYTKLVEQQIFDAIITFLDHRNVDTSDIKERQTTVMNNGVIVSGGSIKADNFAVGARSRAGDALRNATGGQGRTPAPGKT